MPGQTHLQPESFQTSARGVLPAWYSASRCRNRQPSRWKGRGPEWAACSASASVVLSVPPTWAWLIGKEVPGAVAVGVYVPTCLLRCRQHV